MGNDGLVSFALSNPRSAQSLTPALSSVQRLLAGDQRISSANGQPFNDRPVPLFFPTPYLLTPTPVHILLTILNLLLSALYSEITYSIHISLFV